jgi:hypothetical protein
MPLAPYQSIYLPCQSIALSYGCMRVLTMEVFLLWMNDAAGYLSALSATCGGLAVLGGSRGELDG